MKKYLFLVPLLLIVACSKRAEEDHVRVLIPWPNEQGVHELQVVDVETLRNLREMKGDVADIYVHPGLNEKTIEGIRPNAQFSKSSKGYFVPKDTITQEMVAIYAHMEKLKKLDQEIGIDILLSWPRQIGVEVLGVDSRDNKAMTENAMYVSPQDVMLFFPFHNKYRLPVSLNAGVIAHEHFHAIFQRIVIEPLSLKYKTENFEKMEGIKPKNAEDVRSKNNRFILRSLNEGLADVWGSIYINKLEFLTQTLGRQNRDTNPELLVGIPLEFQAMSAQMVDETSMVGYAYQLGSQYARVMQKALLEADLKSASKQQKAIYVIETMMRLRDILLETYDKTLSADILIHALYTREELTAKNCIWLKNILGEKSEYKEVCRSLQ